MMPLVLEGTNPGMHQLCACRFVACGCLTDKQRKTFDTRYRLKDSLLLGQIPTEICLQVVKSLARFVPMDDGWLPWGLVCAGRDQPTTNLQ